MVSVVRVRGDPARNNHAIEAGGRRGEEGVFQQSGPHEWGSNPGSSAPVSPLLALVGFIGLCLLVGAADATIINSGMRHWYPSLTQPPGTPPNWLFAPLWTSIDALSGFAGWLAWRRSGAAQPVRLWGWQLAANALWGPLFFGLRSPAFALAGLALHLGLLGLTTRSFLRVHRMAAVLMLLYTAWIAYIAYLTAGFWWLNRF